MTTAELTRIKERISKTICETWRGDHDGDGHMISVIEGRISADDFMALFAEIDRLNLSIMRHEREQCAILAETLFDGKTDNISCHQANGADKIARAIRARSNI